MKKTIITLGIVNLLTVAVACDPDTQEVPAVSGPDTDDAIVSAAASAIGAALDRVVALPENRDPIRQGNRTFEVSGNVLVRAEGILAVGLESVVRERGWTFVDNGVDPRVCDETMPDNWGWPHCVLGGNDRKALYLDIRSASGTESDGYEVAIWSYRNVSVPFNRDLIWEVGSSTNPEYNRLVTQLSEHPGVLNGTGLFGSPGTFEVTVDPNGATSHKYQGPPRVPGPFRHTPEELAWDAKHRTCHQLRESGDESGYRDCMAEYWEMGEAMLEAFKERAEAVVIAAEERGRK